LFSGLRKIETKKQMAATQISLYQQALEAVEALSVEDQRELIETLNHRFNLRQRQQLITEVKEVQTEYELGQVKFGSVSDFLEELDN
jgi:hypothetical protein